jgi:hypothetical protein
LVNRLDWPSMRAAKRLRAELADWLNDQRDKYILEDV